ncbi:hypothetical protein [Rhizobium sp. G21]|uniref:hypothetical protein n=1 Tax=Rhizobium sp. G21 TaxID=2758439 RepID=UPI001602D84D|nr:hypothetical protein [Rhizobium sp. G21]MBB1248211.1 hypothetical protein [Rhizobium sp. G21]
MEIYGVDFTSSPSRRKPIVAARCRLDDALDALIAAAQASWSWLERDNAFGIPAGTDCLEGWICAYPPS